MGVAVIPGVRSSVLGSLGHALVVDEPLDKAEVIVIAEDGGSAGELEAADLVHGGFARVVAIFSHVPLPEDLEFLRRGVPYEDTADRSERQLTSLGVPAVERIRRTKAGTAAEASELRGWCVQRQVRSVIVVTSTDHSRRLRRLLRRSMAGTETRFIVRPSRYSSFNPDAWWRTRDGIRTEIMEMQKLLLDVLRHPLS